MNKLYTNSVRLGMVSLLLFLLSVLTLVGQTPTTFNYQAVLRDATGHILVSSNVSIQLIIHQGSASGTTVYSEVHNATTTEFGLVNLEIGSVTPATFATIDWAAGPYFVEVIVNGTTMGASELLTVPYALYAVNGVPGPQGDPGPQGIQGETGPQGPPGVITENSVGSIHVIDNSLTTDDLGVGSVGSSEVADNSLTADDLAPNSVGSSEVADNSLEAADIAADAIGASELADNSVGSANVIDNSLTAADLAPNSVGSSELGANAVSTGNILDGTILNADISASAAIAASKLFGDAGIAYNSAPSVHTWVAGEYGYQSLGSITMDIPTSGYVLVIHSGYIRVYNENRILYAGVGTSTTTSSTFQIGGYESGAGGPITTFPYCVTWVYNVSPGTSTFYALGFGFSGLTSGSGDVYKRNLVGIFIPKLY